eukprot:TRINITY_DN438_c0_g1_i4.p1 TRINITY_DN438_c0_g1~~TRINITY_DN438_c0_g1_i4.p1  ORF type:complete len:922 (-),score=259.73 TRINITY_DN438_c0_g1_i4:160-2925(-)
MPSEPAKKVEDKSAVANKDSKDNKDAANNNKDATAAKKGGKKKDDVDELSPEDLKLKGDLELMVQRVQDPSQEIQLAALDSLSNEIRSSTSSMTSVPKPLKFLRPHYTTLTDYYATLPSSSQVKKRLSDILSVLALTMGKEGARESLHYRLAGSKEPVGVWGHEYVRNLAGEVSGEYDAVQEGATATEGGDKAPSSAPKVTLDDLNAIVNEIVPFCVEHNAEYEAVDLLLEVERPEAIKQYIDENNYQRVCLYLIYCSYYVPEPTDSIILKICCELYLKVKQYPDALRVAIKLADAALINEVFAASATESDIAQRQLAFMLARQRMFHVVKPDTIEDETLKGVLANTQVSEYFLSLARDLDIVEAKTPEDIYKSHLEQRAVGAGVDSARGNLASTFVNAFVNAGFGQDKLMTEEGSKWLYKNKEHGMMSAAASLGMVLQWDVESALSQIDKFLYSQEDWVKSGALLGVGIITCGVQSEVDPAIALLAEYIDNTNGNMRIGAILGLGLAYSGTCREDVRDMILPVLEDSSASMEVMSIAGLALGLIFVGSSDGDITQGIMTCLMERTETDLASAHARFLVLGLSLLYLGKQGHAEAALEGLKTLQGPIAQYGALTLDSCAYAGTGNVLKIQQLLSICADHLEEDAASAHQGAAVLGIALIAMGEELGSEMCLRSFDHLLQYGEPAIRRAVPLALALINVSNPTRVAVIDTLSKLSHDHDHEVAMSAIMGLGLVGAGTNNARIAGLLRALATYYYKEANHLFTVRLAQGLLHLGKGTLTLNPFHSDRLLMSHVCVGGLLTILHSCMDIKNTILSKSHYLLYTLACSMSPRILLTLDEDLKELKVPVRVGQAVDVVGQAGKPKTITGFQTHTTPVLLGHGDRAELATDDYIPHTNILEGFVILKKNPNATGNAPGSPGPSAKKK